MNQTLFLNLAEEEFLFHFLSGALLRVCPHSCLNVLLHNKHDRTQLTNITQTHTLSLRLGGAGLPFRCASVRTVCVCLWVQFLSVCVRLADTSVTSALQLHRRRHHECLRGILRVQRVTGCVTAGGVVLALPCRL